MNKERSGLVVFSGGSAANSLVDVFASVSQDSLRPLSYVVPISDNGGSSSELLRVFGGPGIGDIRSRLVRLIPYEPTDPENVAIRAFFNHRLPSDASTARLEWLEIVEARSPLWVDIPTSKKELIRSFLNFLHLEIVKRTRPPTNVFSFRSAAIGNLFLTGARLFCGSFEAAIYLFSSITGLPNGVAVIPSIASNFSHHISAGLENGETIVGQNSISHPGAPTAMPGGSSTVEEETEEHDKLEDATLPGSLPTLRKQYIAFSKDEESDLPSRIDRIWYINPYGLEMRPPANPRAIEALAGAKSLVYSIGSLYTSLVPSLILRDIGNAVAHPGIRHKILVLNGVVDRETGPSSHPLDGLDFVRAVARACHESKGQKGPPPDDALQMYVTHVIYLDGEGVPKVDFHALKNVGVNCVKISGSKEGGKPGLRYDLGVLSKTLEIILGEKSGVKEARRRTLNG